MQRQTETDRDGQRQTETDGDGQRRAEVETDCGQVETDRDRPRQTETDGDRQRQTQRSKTTSRSLTVTLQTKVKDHFKNPYSYPSLKPKPRDQNLL